MRDIVQFVRFNEALSRGNLNEEVLREIPEQLCLFMEHINYKPVSTSSMPPVMTYTSSAHQYDM